MSEETEVEMNPIETLVNQITAGELARAEGSFQSIINDKLTDALESQRIATAQAIFNTPEGLDDEEEDDITDEELQDMVDQVMDEDEDILAELDDDEDFDDEEYDEEYDEDE